MRVDREFKHEFDQEYANASYAGRKIGFKIGLWVIILAVVLAVGGFGYRYISTNADRVIFKESVAYNEGKLDDLAKYRLEMSQTDDPVERAAIQEYVVSVYANYDESKIENSDLREFLEDCRNGEYNVD